VVLNREQPHGLGKEVMKKVFWDHIVRKRGDEKIFSSYVVGEVGDKVSELEFVVLD
jgi:hypothetical protein